MSDSECVSASGLERFFPGNSELAHLMRDLDWSKTDLGHPENWSENLRVAVSLCLTSRIPVVMYWGPNFTVLYNDPYISFLGETKHPRYLGQPGRECWREIWDTIEPMLNSVYETAEATWSEDLLMFFARRLPLEEVYVRFTFGPILAADGRTVEGIFCPCTETTEQVVGARRLETLRKLGIRASEARTVDAACREAAEVLAENPHDIPFAAIYLVDGTGNEVRMSAESGLSAHHPLPSAVSLTESDSLSRSFASEFQTEHAEEISDPDTPKTIVLPIPATNSGNLGLLVVGISPRQVWDAAYRTFFDLAVNHIATAIADAQAYEAERKRAEALAELDRAKTTFFSNISHEFRTPLTLMLNPLEDILAKPNGMQPSDREQLEIVYRNTRRLLKLVNTLLDFSRIEAGRIQAVYEATDLAVLTADLAGVFRSAIERAGMSLRMDCPPLPEPAYVDRQMWEKIVLNLLSNAFKFTFEGEIAVSLRNRERLIELEVRDTGTGIPAEELPYIFERFHRVKGAKGRSYEGSGIGLSLVQELVKLHGGTIHVSSVVDRGTCFTVLIPAGYNHLPSECLRHSEAERIGAPHTLTSTAMRAVPYVEEALRWLPGTESTSSAAKAAELVLSVPTQTKQQSAPMARILVADDNADMRDYLKRLLSQQYEVETVADGVAALAAIDERMPDLVLTDVMMPEVDGFEVLRALRSDPQTREIPLILLSARAGEESRVEGLEAGADDYLTKPFSARELLARVEAILKLTQLRQEAGQRERELRTVSEEARSAAETAQANLQSVLSSINDQFLVLDCEWRYTYVNDRVVEVVGMPKEALLGQCIWDLFPDTAGSKFYIEVHRAVAEQTPVQFEYFYPMWNRWFENHVYPSADGVSIITTEISARKQAEEALRESEERLRRAIEIKTVGVIFFKTDGSITDVNDAFLHMSGYSREDIEQERVRWDKMTPPEWIPHSLQALEELQSTGYTTPYEKEYIRKDGSRWWALFAASRLNDKESVEFIIDITDRKQAEAALREREQRLDLATTAARLGVFEWDVQTDRTIWENQRMYEIFGHTLEDGTLSKAQLVSNVIYPGDREAFEQCLSEGIGLGNFFHAVCRIHRRNDRQWRWVEFNGYFTLTSNNTPLRLVGVLGDITDRKQAEAEREQLLAREQAAREAAEAANRIKDEFLAVLSHELRSPLNPILGWSKLLRNRKLDEAKTNYALEIIERNVSVLAQLIDDLLDVSRILSGKLSLNISAVDLASTIRAAMETVHLAAQAKSIQIHTVLAPEVGHVWGDPNRLQQVVWNLLSNAVKFTSVGGRVDIRLERVDSLAQITISDTGKGIHPDFLPHVFEHFRQEDAATTRRFGGLGLGLAIVRYLAELHGGTVRADSPGEGQGATFTVKLPMMPHQRATNQDTQPSESSLNLNGIRILVVDDDDSTREFIAFLLEMHHANVIAVASAREAIASFTQFKPDVLLSDIGMPDVDGYMLMRQIRALPHQQGGQIPAIALTAYAAEIDYQQAMAAGFQKHLPKPVEPDKLIEVLISLIRPLA
ncbi:ATP-binding protein [Tolypothrix bouteillei VB521301_2]|uniref:Circadian input-output histidine kinase CikA n=1 Tax=Tolypothrix bouteillei VB521301 TaxID=1479485 RepID=A0A0C1R8Y6_9CYAN